jgi:hypothetical protein
MAKNTPFYLYAQEKLKQGRKNKDHRYTIDHAIVESYTE